MEGADCRSGLPDEADQLDNLEKAGDSMNFQYRVRQEARNVLLILGKLEMVEDGDGELMPRAYF